MSKGPTGNIYQLLNNELERLHEHVLFYARSVDSGRMGGNRGPQFNQWSSHDQSMDRLATHSHQRIIEIQSVLLEMLKASDASIQEKMAELLLTGDKNETI